MLDRPIAVPDNSLRRTSAWANTYLGRDHTTRARPWEAEVSTGGSASAEGPHPKP